MNRPLSARPGFTPLPTDPALLTADHARLAFGGDVDAVLRDLIRQLYINTTLPLSQPIEESHHAHR